ncbi:MAG: hypothetical protein GQ474_01610 [Sulfurimonas sp.]|nr:hypothetical protein [Sulfurimonas sp.]
MKNNLHLDQVALKAFNIRNVNQAHILDLLTTVHCWADEMINDNKVYYWVARSVICEELWILDIKSDTAYRHLKKLADMGFIDYIKIGKKDCIRLTKKGKSYSTNRYVGNKSELKDNSETNPNKLGNKSENNSDLNPTYPTTNSDPTTKEPSKEKNTKASFKLLVDEIKASVPRKSKVTFTEKGLELYSRIEDKSKIKDNYISHQEDKEEFSQTLANYLLDYKAHSSKPKDTFDLSGKVYHEEDEF